MTPAQSARALRFVSIGLLLFAATWFTAAIPAIDYPGRLLIDLSDWPLDGAHSVLSRDARWLSAIGAGLLAGMALLMLLVVAPVLESGVPGVRRGALIALTVWYVVDSLGSVTAGVPANAVFNSVYFVLLAVPLVAMKGQPSSAANQSRGATSLAPENK